MILIAFAVFCLFVVTTALLPSQLKFVPVASFSKLPTFLDVWLYSKSVYDRFSQFSLEANVNVCLIHVFTWKSPSWF